MDEGRELSRIKGVGDARAAWLDARFGARTIEQLAALSPDEIEREFKAERVPVSRRVIESWVSAARALVEAEQAAAPTKRAPNAGDWKPLASFVVEFQAPANAEPAERVRTSVNYVEKDRGETWPGIQSELLCQWMLDQMEDVVRARVEDKERGEQAPGAGAAAAEAEREVAPHGTGAAGPPAARLHAEVVWDDGGRQVGAIPFDRAWSVVFEWSTAGERPLEAGEWLLEVDIRPLAPGAPPLNLREEPVRVHARPEVASYEERYEVAPGAVSASHCGTPYRAVAMLTYRPEGEERALLAGFAELGELFFWGLAGAPAQPVAAAHARRE